MVAEIIKGGEVVRGEKRTQYVNMRSAKSRGRGELGEKMGRVGGGEAEANEVLESNERDNQHLKYCRRSVMAKTEIGLALSMGK